MLQSGFEHGIVLYYAVVDNSQPFAFGVMRMSVHGVRLAVCRPTRMRYADATVGILVSSIRLQFRHFALGFVDVQLPLRIDQCYTCTVITAVLQTVQTFNQYRIRLALADISNYSTHKVI